jgi:hypothetical protein
LVDESSTAAQLGLLDVVGIGLLQVAMSLCEDGRVVERTVPMQLDPGTVQLDLSLGFQ